MSSWLLDVAIPALEWVVSGVVVAPVVCSGGVQKHPHKQARSHPQHLSEHFGTLPTTPREQTYVGKPLDETLRNATFLVLAVPSLGATTFAAFLDSNCKLNNSLPALVKCFEHKPAPYSLLCVVPNGCWVHYSLTAPDGAALDNCFVVVLLF